MNIFDIEKTDGLEKVIKENNSIAYASEIVNKVSDKAKERLVQIIDKDKQESIALGTNLNQMDLYYLSNILVTGGVLNKNDDYLDTKEVWAARKSPEDKPFNFNHDFSDIIGHMTECVAIDEEGNLIPDNTDKIPDKFDILVNAVMYTIWPGNEPQQEKIAKAIEKIEEGKLFVSMEARFQDFDYILFDYTSAGEIDTASGKIIKRNKDTAFLTKYLRAYNKTATGKYQGKKIGRVLRSLVFTAEGLVEKPANPESVIYPNELVKAKANEVCENLVYLNISSDMEKRLMSVELENKVKELEGLLTKANEKISVFEKKDIEKLSADFETTKASLVETEKKLVSEVELKTKLETAVAEMKATIEKTNKELELAKAELDKIANEKKSADRVAKIKDVYAFDTTEKAVEKAKIFEKFSDAEFDVVLNTLAEQAKALKVGTEQTQTNLTKPAQGAPKKLSTAGEVLDEVVETPENKNVDVTLASADETNKNAERIAQLSKDILDYCK